MTINKITAMDFNFWFTVCRFFFQYLKFIILLHDESIFLNICNMSKSDILCTVHLDFALTVHLHYLFQFLAQSFPWSFPVVVHKKLPGILNIEKNARIFL